MEPGKTRAFEEEESNVRLIFEMFVKAVIAKWFEWRPDPPAI